MEALRIHFGLEASELAFLALGNDSSSFAFRATAEDGGAYFVKVRSAAGFGEPSLAVPRFLQDRGVPNILAPLRTLSGGLWVPLGDFALSLYPFIEWRMVAVMGLTSTQWQELGATVRRFHALASASEIAGVVPQERFVPGRRELMGPLEQAVDGARLSAVESDLSAFWRSHRHLIHAVVGRCDLLANQLRAAGLTFVLCHADLHSWNLLVDACKRLWIVDWDEVILAPKERDLMFVIEGLHAGLVSPRETECFLQGYGDAVVDPRALAYYRCAWAVQDMAAFAETVFFLPDCSEGSRRDALRGFEGLFEPGGTIELAMRSDVR